MQKKDKNDVILTKLKENLFKHGIILDHNLLTILTRKDGKSNYRIGIWGDLVCADWRADGIYKKIWYIPNENGKALEKIANSLLLRLENYNLEKQWKIFNKDGLNWAYEPMHSGWHETAQSNDVTPLRDCFFKDETHPECDRHCAIKAVCKSNTGAENTEKVRQIEIYLLSGKNSEQVNMLTIPQKVMPEEKREIDISEVKIIHSGQDIEDYFK